MDLFRKGVIMNCPLCNEHVGDKKLDLRYHLSKEHNMHFSDDAEMARRMLAVGIDIEEFASNKTSIKQLTG